MNSQIKNYIRSYSCKLAVLISFIFLLPSPGKCQETGTEYVDEWYRDIGSKALKVGDTMKDIPFGEMINDLGDKKRFSDLKGKLVILDFWSTYCTSCMENFPHMESLQKEFGDRIQIILVNPFESRQQIKERTILLKGKLNIPNLPVIIGSDAARHNGGKNEPLNKLFPTRGVPHHVWINSDGVIILSGGGFSTYASKIKTALQGEKFFVMNNSSTVPLLGVPLTSHLPSLNKVNFLGGAILTEYNNEVAVANSPSIYGDSTRKVVSFINEELFVIYANAFKDRYWGQLSNLIYMPLATNLGFLVLPKGDTLRFTSRFLKDKKTDSQVVRSRYCFEYILSPDNDTMDLTLQLNNYFSHRLGTIAKINPQSKKYYAVIRKAGHSTTGTSTVKVRDLLYEMVGKSPALKEQLKKNYSQGNSFIILDDTLGGEVTKTNDMLKFEGVSSIVELRSYIGKYGLDIVERERKFNYLVFEEVSK